MPRMDVGNKLIWRCLRQHLPSGTRLTSVCRSPENQLALIVRRATSKGYAFKRPPHVNDESSWLEAWRLVNTKDNPVAKPGRSMHQKGLAYDLAGPNLHSILAAIKQAAAKGSIHLIPPRPGWTNPRLEGGCVHVEIDAATLDFDPFDYA